LPILQNMPSDMRDFFISNDEANVLLEEYEGAGDYLRVVANEAGIMSKRGSTVSSLSSRRQSVMYSNSSLDSRRASSLSGTGAFHDKSRDFKRLKEIISDRSSSLRQRNDSPVTVVDWISLYDETGKLTRSKADLMNMIFTRSVETDIRPEIWKVFINTCY
jgi:hypothetical protein